MFKLGNSKYKRNGKAETQNYDMIMADSLIKEVIKIAKTGVAIGYSNNAKSKTGEISVDKFWTKYISKSTTIRWDVFEEKLLAFIEINMILDKGIIRKVNWKLFF